MYRGSRLAASFLLVATGLAVSTIAVFVAPAATATPFGTWLVPAAVALAFAHWIALVGVVRARDWGRNLAVFLAELCGGLAILSAVVLLTGGRPLGLGSEGPALAAWT